MSVLTDRGKTQMQEPIFSCILGTPSPVSKRGVVVGAEFTRW